MGSEATKAGFSVGIPVAWTRRQFVILSPTSPRRVSVCRPYGILGSSLSSDLASGREKPIYPSA